MFLLVWTEYFQHFDNEAQRMDRCERLKLMLGVYGYLATKHYYKVSNKIYQNLLYK